MRKENLTNSIYSVLLLSILILIAIFFIDGKKWIGIIFVILGLVHVFILKFFFNRKINSVFPDLIFGAIDNGFLVVGAIIGAEFAGILGAIIGGAAMNAITDGFAGIFEGHISEHLRKNKIKEHRTSVSSAIGKMAGCLFGAGFVLIIAWTILSL